MRPKLFFSLFISLLGMLTISAQAQSFSFNITKWSGENQNVALQSIDKVTFSEDDLILNYVSDETESVDMLSIRRITFYAPSTGIQNPDKDKEIISVFPNPVHNLINIKNLSYGNHEVQVFSLLGKLILQTQVASGSSAIDVSNLKSGMYLIKVDNQTIKFIKQ